MSRKWGTKKRFRRAPYAKKVANKRFAKRVKKIINKTAEPKSFPYSHAKSELNHSSIALLQLNGSSQLPSQGAGDKQRVGDQINLSGFKLRMVIGQKADRPNVTFRYWVIRVPKGSTYTYNQWFTATTSNTLLDDVNTDFIKVLTTGTWKPHDGSMDNATDEYTYLRKLWVPYKKILKFGPGDGVNTHNDSDIYFMCTVYDAYGTLITDNIAYVQLFSEVFYRDP